MKAQIMNYCAMCTLVLPCVKCRGDRQTMGWFPLLVLHRLWSSTVRCTVKLGSTRLNIVLVSTLYIKIHNTV